MSKLAEDQCCEYGCPGGACESCACCVVGWCINGRDDVEFERNATEEDREAMAQIKKEVAEGNWRKYPHHED